MQELDREHLKVFQYKMKQLDELRGEDFQKTFPELEDLYNAV